MEDLRFPTGRLRIQPELTDARRAELIDRIEATPAAVRKAVAGLDDARLDTPYRPGGWTVRQVVHHLPDSHMNAYIRFRWALTEDNPTIKTYTESAWAELPDARSAPVEPSLTLLESLHDRLVRLLRSFGPAEHHRPFVHPEVGPMTLDGLLQIYGWHGPHHTAHITSLRQREGW